MAQAIVGSLRRWDPERIGPYSIIGRLGAGAMGQVFLARSTAGRLVAVKTIRVELSEEPGFRTRFAREVAAARRVSGVFTAAVVEADPDADLPWLATAYVPAPSLNALVRNCGPLPVPAVRWLAAGCAEALQSIHSAGLLHRDVKPSNVLVAPDGPRVIDFGVARAAERVALTVTRGTAGTPAYMAPEQARDSAQASPASDVFSLGATLVFAATGHPPYQGETVMDVLVRLATEPPDLTGVPSELAPLVAACLERVPRDRPSNASILGRLGSFAAASAKAGPGHSYLPDSAMAMIAEYQHHPQLTGEADSGDAGDYVPGDYVPGEATDGSIARAGGDVTSETHTPLPGFHSVAAFLAEKEGEQTGSGQRAGRGRSRRAGARGLAPPSGRPLAWAGIGAAAMVLVGAGAVIGLLVGGFGANAAGGRPPPNGQPPPASCTVPTFSSTPQLCSSQPYGDRYSVFVIHGSGFVPGKPVRISLHNVAVSPAVVFADNQGDFNYAIDQGHHFFKGYMSANDYTVTATGPNGLTATTSFIVNPPGGPPPGGGGQPPNGPPPGGQ